MHHVALPQSHLGSDSSACVLPLLPLMIVRSRGHLHGALWCLSYLHTHTMPWLQYWYGASNFSAACSEQKSKSHRYGASLEVPEDFVHSTLYPWIKTVHILLQCWSYFWKGKLGKFWWVGNYCLFCSAPSALQQLFCKHLGDKNKLVQQRWWICGTQKKFC